MCGRFTLTATQAQLEEEFGIPIPNHEPSYNVAPSQKIMSLVGSDDGMKAGMFKWGLVPRWAKDKKIGYKMINARSETLEEKPAFKHLLTQKRCLIVADSFYEWDRHDKKPYRIRVNNGEIVTFAGLWDRWKSEEESLVSCTIITTNANDQLKHLHERMPVILNEGNRQAWLDRTITDKDTVKRILVPYEGHMDAYPVSTLVNNPRNNSKELIQPL